MTSSLFANPDLVLLEVPGTGASVVRERLGPPVARKAMSGFDTAAPRLAVLRHPFARFARVVDAFAAGIDGKPPLIAGLDVRKALTYLTHDQVPADLSRAYPPARLKHALMPMTHPVHRLHEASHFLRAETLDRDWAAIDLALPAPPACEPRQTLPDYPEDLRAELSAIYADDFARLGYVPDTLAPCAAPRAPAGPDAPLVWDLWPAFFDHETVGAEEPQSALPAPDCPLDPFVAAPVAGRRGPTWTGRDANLIAHFRNLQPEFADASRLSHLLAASVVVLRRAPHCTEAQTLFHRILKTHGQAVAVELKLRWLVSVCDTLADHGETQGQRALGLAGSLLANTLKLSETERKVFGPDRPWPPRARWSSGGALFDGLITYWVEKGEMIGLMRKRLDRVAQDDPVAGPIVAEIMARALRHDTVYKRLGDLAGAPSPPLLDPALRAEIRAMLADVL